MKSKINLSGTIIGLDIGAARTGVARVNTVARIAEPLAPIDMRKNDFLEAVLALVQLHEACAVVAGMPRNLSGDETAQTRWVAQQVDRLKAGLSVPVFTIDEAGSTKEAEQRAVGKETSIDSVAAGILVEDFIAEVERGRIINVTI